MAGRITSQEPHPTQSPGEPPTHHAGNARSAAEARTWSSRPGGRRGARRWVPGQPRVCI